MGQDALRQKISQRLSKDAPGVIRTLKTAGVKLSSAEEAGISRGSLDQFSDAQLSERFNTKVLGMLGITGADAGSSQQGAARSDMRGAQQGKGNANTYESQQGKNATAKTDNQNKKRKPE